MADYKLSLGISQRQLALGIPRGASFKLLPNSWKPHCDYAQWLVELFTSLIMLLSSKLSIPQSLLSVLRLLQASPP